MITGIGHIGIFVADIEAALETLTAAFGLDMPAITDVPERSMRVTVIPWGAVNLELVEDYSDDGFVARLVKERGSFIHHFCLLSDDLKADIAALRHKGVKMVQAEPAVGQRGKLTTFVSSGVLDDVPIELSEP